MTRVALVKPDHLGDVVLSAPAIRAAAVSWAEVTLFVSSTSYGLARFLFPEIGLRTLDFPHLARKKAAALDAQRLGAELDGFDLVLWLRDDPVIRSLCERVRAEQDFASGGHLTHETAIQKRMLLRHLPNYSRSALFAAEPIPWPGAIRSVGLCVAAGFPTNRWPNAYWLELAARLAGEGVGLTLIGGPGERQDLALLSKCLNVPHGIVIGGTDFPAFLDGIGEVDLVVATDGGAAHICSLAKPVLSLFGSSPWRRYAPFGAENVVITRDLCCSPCMQFSTEHVNGCVTRECLAGLPPEPVVDLFRQLREAPAQPVRRHGLIVQRGTSHSFED